MKYNLADRVLKELSSFAQKHSITKIVLFGFRHEVQTRKEVI